MSLPVSAVNREGDLSFDVDDLLKKEIEADDHLFVVLDDDPTGVQTVHDVSVYTDWSYDSLEQAFEEKEKIVFLLTNSRAMSVKKTTEVHREIAERVRLVSKKKGRPYLFISRGDSTLRGHYPLETELLSEGLEETYGHVDGEILFPFFKEGGRYTLDSVHYVRYGYALIPAAETEFAKDRTFGYTHSDLRDYIEEKTGGKVKREDVLTITIEELRNGDLDGIEGKLVAAEDYRRIAVDAADYTDVKVFCTALYRAIRKGKVFVFRSAAGFVKCMGGISDQDLLKREDMIGEETGNGGLIVVGSHTAKTTAQLEKLLALPGVVPVKFASSKVLSEGDFEEEIKRCIALEEEILIQGKSAVVYTERTLLSLPDDTKESALARSVKISEGVTRLVSECSVKPAFVIAKGGITSSDVGTKGLGVKKARVLGQIEPGIPVWKTDPDSRFPHIPYVIFPGNVGEDDTLRKAAAKLTGEYAWK